MIKEEGRKRRHVPQVFRDFVNVKSECVSGIREKFQNITVHICDIASQNGEIFVTFICEKCLRRSCRLYDPYLTSNRKTTDTFINKPEELSEMLK